MPPMSADQITPEMKQLLQEAKAYCEQDIKKICGGELPGNGRYASCMMENFEKLSSPCKDKLMPIFVGAGAVDTQ